MDIKLSISLLASNRKESLERCLDSLKPLLVKIPSELIIVLTATDLNVRKIAEEYTPQIVPFEWCDDFSAARNAGLEKARGEWFLFIDDDEWFDDVEEICDFFLSGEYKRYRSAHYIQRNYQNWDGTEFSDFSAFRMVRRLPQSRFQGAIHEELRPRLEPCRYFQTCVHHYGYAHLNTDKNNNQKTTRNIRMLLRSIQEHPNQIKNYIQVTKEYDLEGNWKTAMEYCRKGRLLCQEAGESHLDGWLQAYLSDLLCRNPCIEQPALEIESILEKEHPSELICLVLYQQLIQLYTNGMEPEKVVRCGLKFEELLDDMDCKDTLWEEQGYGEFCEEYVKNPRRLYGSRIACIDSALALEQQENAAYFSKRLPWDKEEILQWYYPYFEVWKLKYTTAFTEILSDVIMDDRADRESENSILPVYLLLQRALAFLRSGKKEEAQELFLQCISRADSDFLKQMLLKESVYNQIGASHLASRMNLDVWDTCLTKVMEGLPYSLLSKVQACEDELRADYPYHSHCLRKHRNKLELSKGFPLWEKLVETLEEYCLSIMEYYRGIFREELFRDENSICLPDECRFAIITGKALDLFGQGQWPEAVRLFGEAIQISPAMTGVITEFFRQAARRMDNPEIQAGDEFLQLAGQMKEMLDSLLSAGQMEQAKEVLDQLLPLLPEDLELIRIRQELIRRRKS